jgi:predicted DNA-binding transcriptional regulator YafY
VKKKAHRDLADPGTGRRLRLHFIELVAWWEGAVRRQIVCDAFGVTPNHVTTDLAYYRGLHPDNLVYDVSARAWRPSPAFKPAFMAGSPEEFLALLRARLEGFAWIPGRAYAPTITATSLPRSNNILNSEVLHQAVLGIRKPASLAIRFHDAGSPKPCNLQVWPLALILEESRWLLRVYDIHGAGFRNLPLAQILSATPLASHPMDSPPADADWDTTVRLTIRPNPQLPTQEQRLIARAHGMERCGPGWAWRVTLRKCLVSAFIRTYHLEGDDPKASLVLS